MFNLDVIIYGRINQCSFVHNSKKVKLMPNQPKPPTPRKKSDKGKIVVNLISHNQIERSLNKGLMCYALVARKAEPETEAQISKHVKRY